MARHLRLLVACAAVTVVAAPILWATAAPSHPREPVTIAVVGDSIAGTIVWGLDDIMRDGTDRLVSRAYPACGVASGEVLDPKGRIYPWSPDCAKNVGPVHTAMIRTTRPDVVLWSSSWEVSNRYDPKTKTELHFGSRRADRVLLAAIDTAARRLTAGGAQLVFLTVAPPGATATKPGDIGHAESHYNDLLREYAAKHPGTMSVLDVMAFVCPGGPPCPATVDGVALRPDSIHYTHETAPIVARWLLPHLVEAAQRGERPNLAARFGRPHS